MKKLLSAFCMAVLAGGLIFTSCTKTFTITVNSNNDAWGTVTGGGTYNDQATATLTATPKPGYQFVKWQDGVKENPRTITVTANETYTAYFEAIPSNPGVKVTFNGSTWDASDYAGSYFTGTLQSGQAYAGWGVSAAQNSDGSYPVSSVSMLTGKNTGSFTGTAGENGAISSNDFNFIEYYKDSYLYDESNPDTHFGDWWAKSATVNVTAFDATSLNMSANVNATMFNASEAFVDGAGVAAATTAPMTEAITSVTLTNAKAGAMVKKHNGKKLVAAR